MLTVRINGVHGDQVLFEAATVVRCDPPKDCTPVSGGRIEFYNDKHEEAYSAAVYGSVFVMNSAGKTVAKYDLGGWADPV